MPQASDLLDHDFLPGMREDVDRNAAPPGTLMSAENVRYGRQGGIYPRAGSSAVYSTSIGPVALRDITTPVGAVMNVGDSNMVAADGMVYSRSAEGVFRFAGAYSTCLPVQRRRGLIGEKNNGFGQSRYGIAINSTGYVLLAASDGVSVSWSIEDSSGFRTVVGQIPGTKCACLSINSTDFILVVQGGTSLVAFNIFLLSPGQFSVSNATVATLANATDKWDITPAVGNGSDWYIAYQQAAANVRVLRCTALSVSGTVANQAVSTVATPISLYASSVEVWLGWYNDPTGTGDVRVRTIELNLSAFRSAATTINSAALIYGPPLIGPSQAGSSSAFIVFRDGTSEYGTQFLRGVSPNNSAVAVTMFGFPAPIWGIIPISKPDANQRVWVVSQPNGFPQTLLLRFYQEYTNGLLPTEYAPMVELCDEEWGARGVGVAALGNDYFHHVASNGTRQVFAAPFGLRDNSAASLSLLGLYCYEYETTAAHFHRDFASTGQTVVVAGQPVEFPGSGSPVSKAITSSETVILSGGADIGFAPNPWIASVSSSTAAGSLTPGATYSYVVVREWIDSYGRRYRSAPSSPVSVTLGATHNTVSVLAVSNEIGQRQNLISASVDGRREVLHLYRLLNGAFRRVTPSVGAPQAFSALGDVTITDSLSDANALLQEILYTDGGVAAFSIAPSCRYLCASEDRIWFAGLWQTNLIQASRLLIPGEPVQCAAEDVFKVQLPEPCTGIAYQDGSVVAFAKRSIYLVSGDGPDDQKRGQFSPPRALSRDIGCTDYRSILETAIGILFQSERGFYLLPRGFGQPIWVGAPVQTTLTAYRTCLAAAVHSDSRERTARFLMADSNNNTIVLSLDLDLTSQLGYGVWAKHSFATWIDNPDTKMSSIGSWSSGTFAAYRTISSPVYLVGSIEANNETIASDGYTSGSHATITGRIETANISPAGNAGMWRCNSVITSLSNCDGGVLDMLVTTDDDDGSTTISPEVTEGSLYCHVAPANPACTNVWIRLTSTRAVGSSAYWGPTFHGITIEWSKLPGARRTTAAQR